MMEPTRKCGRREKWMHEKQDEKIETRGERMTDESKRKGKGGEGGRWMRL